MKFIQDNMNSIAGRYGMASLEDHLLYWGGEETEGKLVWYKCFLTQTDYICAKIVEGVSTWAEYEEEREARNYCRNKIRELMTN